MRRPWQAVRTTVVLGIALLVMVALPIAPVQHMAAAGCPTAPTDPGPPGLAALRHLPGDATVTAIATHERGATPAAQHLTRLGLAAQTLRHLPMTLLRGPVAALRQAVAVEGVADVYPDQRLWPTSAESTRAIGADEVWDELGVTGRGVGIAIVDSGLDATHPAFEGRVRRNVKIVGAEYLTELGLPADGSVPRQALVLSVDEAPYRNTDTYGHGTHVAGIAAAADLEDPDDSPVGVAPQAHLVSYAVGELHVFTVLAAFDDILATHDEHNIRVVNNSWATRFAEFDPDAPLHLATRTLADAGLVVTFAAGNESQAMTLNGAAVAPWVIGVGSATLGGAALPTSSGGLPFDNSSAVPFDGHTRFDGDGLGLYHPTVTAPGHAINSAATPTGAAFALGPQTPGGTVRRSGTSMSAPHVAGLAALLLEANPGLQPADIKRILQVTAAPAPGWSVWKSGFGFVDAGAAVTYAADPAFDGAALATAYDAREAALQSRRDHTVAASDHWAFTAGAPAAVAGLDSRCFAFEVAAGDPVTTVTASAAFAASSPYRNDFRWRVELRDAAGALVATSPSRAPGGVATATADASAAAPGTWTVTVAGELAVTDARPLATPEVTVVATQLVSRPLPPPAGDMHTLMLDDGAPLPAATSPEGCALTAPPTTGTLSSRAGADCGAALVGVDAKDVAGVVNYTGEPLQAALPLAGSGELVLHLADEAHPARRLAIASRVYFTVDAFDPTDPDAAVVIASGQPLAEIDATPVRGSYPFAATDVTVPAGWAMRLRLYVTGAGTNLTRLLYGGSYDSHLTLSTR